MNNKEQIDYILSKRIIKAEKLFNSIHIIRMFTFKRYSDNEYILIGYSYKNNNNIYSYIDFNSLSNVNKEILDQICFFIDKNN